MAAASASSLAGARLRTVVVAWKVAAVGGLVTFAAYTLFGAGFDQFFNRYWYNALILLAAGAAVVRAVTTRIERTAAIAFAVGISSWAVGEILFDFPYAGNPPYPSAADAFYLLFYPACYVGMAILVRHRLSEFTPMVWFDGAMAAIAAAAVGSAVLFEVVLTHTDGSTSVIVTNLAYPLGDVLLLSVVAGVFSLTGWRPDRTWALIGASLLTARSPTGSSSARPRRAPTRRARSSTRSGRPRCCCWPPRSGSRHDVDVALDGRPLLATSLICAAIGLGILVFDHFQQLNLLAVSLAAATLVAVVVRLVLTFRENRRLLELLRTTYASPTLSPASATAASSSTDLARVLRRRRTGRAETAGDLRPRRLQALQRQLRPPRRRRAADAARGAHSPGGRRRTGRCYRLGGDEFCVLADVAARGEEPSSTTPAEALSERASGSRSTSSLGAVLLPRRRAAPPRRCGVADQRLYAQKRERSRRGDPHEVLLQALFERCSRPARPRRRSVVDRAVAIGETFGLAPDELEELRLAARLHDVGKIAVPDESSASPARSTDEEWAFIRQHTVIGQRILAASPALARASARSSGRRTSAGTARATRTASPARRSLSPRASSPSATPSTR